LVVAEQLEKPAPSIAVAALPLDYLLHRQFPSRQKLHVGRIFMERIFWEGRAAPFVLVVQTDRYGVQEIY